MGQREGGGRDVRKGSERQSNGGVADECMEIEREEDGGVDSI